MTAPDSDKEMLMFSRISQSFLVEVTNSFQQMIASLTLRLKINNHKRLIYQLRKQIENFMTGDDG